MAASIKEVDFRGNDGHERAHKEIQGKKGKVYEPGEHRGCAFVADRHFHVQKPGGKAQQVKDGGKSKSRRGSKSGG